MKQPLAMLLICALLLSLTGCFYVTPNGTQVAAGQAGPAPVIPPETRAGNPAPVPEQSPASSQTPASSDPVILTEEEVRDIALAHAGLTADQVQRLRVELDRDDGIWQYEVDFHDGKTEYEFEIHAETGEIRSYDRDRLGD